MRRRSKLRGLRQTAERSTALNRTMDTGERAGAHLARKARVRKLRVK